MAEFPAVHENGVPGWRQRREPTRLECGLLGALTATIFLGILFWLGIQFSLLKLVIQIS
jgi:hypothetical protein